MLELEGKHEQDMKAVTQQSEKLGFLEQQVSAQCNWPFRNSSGNWGEFQVLTNR